jgi:hypothetical protein
MDHALGHGQRAIADVNRQQHLALGVHRDPDPLGRPLQALDRVGFADRAVLDRTEESKQLIELHLLDPHVVQDVSGKGPQLLRRFHQPLQHGVRVDLKDSRRAPDAQPLGQARDDTHDEVARGALAVKNRAEGLAKIATTDHTQ